MINKATHGIMGGQEITISPRIVHPLVISLANKKPLINVVIKKKISILIKGVQ